MAKKNFDSLESGNKNMGGVNALFTNPPSKKVLKEENKITHFSLVIPIEGYLYIRSLINLKVKQGELSYSIKKCFLEGLHLLMEDNPLITSDSPLERRFYRGGGQKNKIESYATSVTIEKFSINWIDNYILEQAKKDEFYSKPDFINDLIEKLKVKYGKKL